MLALRMRSKSFVGFRKPRGHLDVLDVLANVCR